MNQKEARIRHLLVYNSGKMCINNHDPTIRITTTGRCMVCEKEYHGERLKAQKARNRRCSIGYKAVYTFPFPDGDRVSVGPFVTASSAQKALERRWLVFYGINFNPKFLPEHDAPLELQYKWKE